MGRWFELLFFLKPLSALSSSSSSYTQLLLNKRACIFLYLHNQRHSSNPKRRQSLLLSFPRPTHHHRFSLPSSLSPSLSLSLYYPASHLPCWLHISFYYPSALYHPVSRINHIPLITCNQATSTYYVITAIQLVHYQTRPTAGHAYKLKPRPQRLKLRPHKNLSPTP